MHYYVNLFQYNFYLQTGLSCRGGGGGIWFPALICTGNQLAKVFGACFTWVKYPELYKLIRQTGDNKNTFNCLLAEVWNSMKIDRIIKIIWAPSSEFVSSSIPSLQIVTAHAQPFRGARNLAFCLKVPLDSLLVWASSEGSGETARMRRLAWTFAARIGDKYQIRLTRSI